MKKKIITVLCTALALSVCLVGTDIIPAIASPIHRIPAVPLRTHTVIESVGVGTATAVVQLTAASLNDRMPLSDMLRAEARVYATGFTPHREMARSSEVSNQAGTATGATVRVTARDMRQGMTVRAGGRVRAQEPWRQLWTAHHTVSGGSGTVRSLPSIPDVVQYERSWTQHRWTINEFGDVSPVGREDLIAVSTTNGDPGWAYIPSLDIIRPDNISCDDWFAYLAERNRQPRYYDVFGDDFTTVIGQFEVSPSLTFEEMVDEVYAAGMPLPLDPTPEDYLRAIAILPTLRGSVEYLATLDGGDAPTLSDIRAEVETAGVRLSRMATDFEIMEAFVNLRAPAYLAQYELEWDGIVVIESFELDETEIAESGLQ